MNQPLVRIGELAKRTQISVEALRYYEKEHLIKPKMRSQSGYRLYSKDDETRLNFVLHAKKVGFSLTEIKELLALRLNKDEHTCEEVKSYTGTKLKQVEQKINDLKQMHCALNALHIACCGGSETANNCTILTSLDGQSLSSFKQ